MADIIATYQGLSLNIEVKIGLDKQSKNQKRVQQEIEASGGLYFIARDFDGFVAWQIRMSSLKNKIRKLEDPDELEPGVELLMDS